jgi:lysophospholipase L1-like esterase
VSLLSRGIGLRAAVVLTLFVFACGGDTTTTPTPPPPAAPVISCPDTQTAASPLNTVVPVTYPGPTVTGGQAPITTVCTPSSGSSFPVGSTTVSCSAIDSLQRPATCSFRVVVTPAPVISVTSFIAFGDSITWGEDGTNPPTLLGTPEYVRLYGFEYPTDLTSALRMRYQLQAAAINVTNDGKPGEALSDPTAVPTALDRFRSDVLGRGFQAVLLMEGSNDVNTAVKSGNSVLDTAIANLQTMIRSAKSSGVRPYLASIPPMNPTSVCIPTCRGIGAALVPGYNVRLSTLAFAEGIPFVDVNAAFGGDLSLLSTDGLHPNANGYQRIADTFFQTLKATLDITPASSLIAPGRAASVKTR